MGSLKGELLFIQTTATSQLDKYAVTEGMGGGGGVTGIRGAETESMWHNKGTQKHEHVVFLQDGHKEKNNSCTPKTIEMITKVGCD